MIAIAMSSSLSDSAIILRIEVFVAFQQIVWNSVIGNVVSMYGHY